jgi:hypothetical protein
MQEVALVLLGGLLVIVGVSAGFGGAYFLVRLGVVRPTPVAPAKPQPVSQVPAAPQAPPIDSEEPVRRLVASPWRSIEEPPSAYPPPAYPSGMMEGSAPLTPDDPHPLVTAAELKRADAMAEVAKMAELRERFGEHVGTMLEGWVPK